MFFSNTLSRCGAWSLELGAWSLELGAWSLECFSFSCFLVGANESEQQQRGLNHIFQPMQQDYSKKVRN